MTKNDIGKKVMNRKTMKIFRQRPSFNYNPPREWVRVWVDDVFSPVGHIDMERLQLLVNHLQDVLDEYKDNFK